MRKEPRMFSSTELPSKPKKLSRESIRRRMKRTRSVLRTKSSSLKKTPRRESKPFMRQERS